MTLTRTGVRARKGDPVDGTRHHRRRAAALVLGLVMLVGAAWAGAGENPRLALPKSDIDRPFRTPVYVCGHAALAAAGVVDGVQPGGGAAFLFRPENANRFLGFLSGWNTSLVLQAEYHKVGDDLRILSGGMIFRRYLKDFSPPAPFSSWFVGAGVGASEVTLAPEDGGGMETGWEYLGEAGQEFNPRENLVVYWQLQYRSYRYHAHDFSHFSVKVGAGVPWPW